MADASLKLFPYCAQCFGIQAKEEEWLRMDGTAVTTVRKLDVCARCCIERYCSERCQRLHLSVHGLHCKQAPGYMPAAEMDRLVKRVCAVQSGKVQVNYAVINGLPIVRNMPEQAASAGRLDVTLVVEGRLLGHYQYLVCHQAKSE